VWTLHDCWSFTGHCAYFDYARCDRWQTECHHCPQLKTYPICYGPDGSRRNYRLKKKLFTSLPSLTLTPPCHWLADTLRRSFLSQYPVRVIENGVDLSVFHPTESDLRKRYQLGAPYIVLAVAAEWTERKGLRYLLACARRLPCDYQLVVLGLTDAQIAQLPQGVLGLPKTASAHELAAWYTLASVVANPTMEDNMPLVNLEALACGTPVAVFRTGGCPEAVDDTCGRVVEQGDADGLREAVMALAPRKKELEQQCLARAKRFDSRDCYQKYCALYREVRR
ncbi:MAG: glycosyltransferase, partial [Clostridia bacterium]|nr:glycosyltransferase [Clostridia bacterium]